MQLRGLLTSVGVVIGTLAAAEFVCRIVTWSPQSAERISDGIGGQRYAFYPSGAGDLVPNQDGHWIVWHHRPYHVETNGLGLRSREEPQPGALRIVATGDSQTFGPYVANEDAWPGWLQADLGRAVPVGDPIQVFNAAVSGYTITDQLAWLRDKGVEFKPNWVLLGVFENDVTDLRKTVAGEPTRPTSTSDRDTRLVKYWIKRIRKYLGENLAAYALIERLKTQANLAAAGVDVRRGETMTSRAAADTAPDLTRLESMYVETFREFIATARAAGIKIAVIGIPDVAAIEARASGPVARLVRDHAGQLKVPFLDLHDDLMRVPDAVQVLYLIQWDPAAREMRGNGHLSRYGHRVVGARVSSWLLELFRGGSP